MPKEALILAANASIRRREGAAITNELRERRALRGHRAMQH
jgi:hypothetical protein